MMTVSLLTAVVKVVNYNADTFYASDLGLKGGTIQALESYGLIERTGKTKDYLIEIDTNLFRKVFINEWRIIRRELHPVWFRNELESFAAEVLACADLLRSESGY